MKTKYTFSVRSTTKLDPNMMFPIQVRGVTYKLILDNDFIVTNLEVVVNCPEKYFPVLNDNGGIYELNIHNPIIHFIYINLTGIEALMSIYGFESIDKKNYSILWIPENKDEEEKLNINNYKTEVSCIPPSEMTDLSFHLVARSILASWEGANISMSGSFFRKGTMDMRNGDFISSIFNFYLIFESGYGNGRWRGYQVKKEYDKSENLKKAFCDAIMSDKFKFALDSKLLKEFTNSEVYSSKEFSKYFSHFVDLRGSLQHHNSKKEGVWDPLRPEVYELDAKIMSAICFQLIALQIIDYLHEEDIINDYKTQAETYYEDNK